LKTALKASIDVAAGGKTFIQVYARGRRRAVTTE
jgi:hypothetical protein